MAALDEEHIFAATTLRKQLTERVEENLDLRAHDLTAVPLLNERRCMLFGMEIDVAHTQMLLSSVPKDEDLICLTEAPAKLLLGNKRIEQQQYFESSTRKLVPALSFRPNMEISRFGGSLQ